MTIRQVLDGLHKEIDNHQAAVKRLQKLKAQIVAAAGAEPGREDLRCPDPNERMAA